MNHKIYLDQKDYSCIARGLCGEEKYKSAITAYNLLRNLVNSGKVTVYFSHCHLIESLKYGYPEGDLWAKHCEAVDNLTAGNCIVFTEELARRELELFLSEHFGFKTDLSQSNYSYGKYRDAVPPYQITYIKMKETVKNKIEQNLKDLNVPRSHRKQMLKDITKDLFNYLKKLSDSEFEEMISKVKGDNVFLQDMKEFMSDKDRFIEFILGDHLKQKRIVNDLLNHVFNFKKLVRSYRSIFPQLNKLANFPQKETFRKLDSTFKSAQVLYDFGYEGIIDENSLKELFVSKFLNHFKPEIKRLSKKHNFPKKEAQMILAKTNFENLPSIHAAIIFAIEYAKSFKGSERRRKAKYSDIIDLWNLQNLPYVDFFITDRSFAGLSKKMGHQMFGTTVLKNLDELVNVIEKKYSFGQRAV